MLVSTECITKPQGIAQGTSAGGEMGNGVEAWWPPWHPGADFGEESPMKISCQKFHLKSRTMYDTCEFRGHCSPWAPSNCRRRQGGIMK